MVWCPSQRDRKGPPPSVCLLSLSLCPSKFHQGYQKRPTNSAEERERVTYYTRRDRIARNGLAEKGTTRHFPNLNISRVYLFISSLSLLRRYIHESRHRPRRCVGDRMKLPSLRRVQNSFPENTLFIFNNSRSVLRHLRFSPVGFLRPSLLPALLPVQPGRARRRNRGIVRVGPAPGDHQPGRDSPGGRGGEGHATLPSKKSR